MSKVFVDPLRPWVPTKDWPWRRSCRLLAGEEDELHRFAEKLGLPRRWCQRNEVRAYYRLTPGMREQALAHGAREVPHRRREKQEKRHWKGMSYD